MSLRPTSHTATVAFIAALFVLPSYVLAASRPNVLLIAVDDLRPELGCYGVKHVISPNIDRLAKRGVTFLRAYCQQAVCNPSRTSMMTGLRPDSIGVTGNHTHFRSNRPNVVTLPQQFKRNGYHAQSIGKIYHGVFPEGASKTTWDTMGDPLSWSVPTTRFGPRYYYTEEGIRQAKQAYLRSYKPANPQDDDWTKKLIFGPMTEAPDVPDNTLYDGKVADAAIAALRMRREATNPFFLAVGFIKPHTPFVAPKKYWNLYDPTKIPLATTGELPKAAPRFAGHNSGEVRRYTDQPKRGPFSEKNRRRLKHGYYACISYVDAQVGRVLDELDRLRLTESTIVVLFGDHGWHLGEHGLWGKTTNFELDTRAPFIISTPAMKATGRQSRALVEFVDLYPTLSDLAGLPISKTLEGQSLKPLLDNPDRKGKSAAFSQYPRGKSMGYSMRTDSWRYTEWVHRSTGTTTARELYNHTKDSRETVNVAADSRYDQLVAQLSRQLRSAVVKQPRKPASPSVASTPSIGFEDLPAGPFTKLSNRNGTLEAPKGHATIHTQHQRSGKQCLRLLGGKDHQVVWTPSKSKNAVDRYEVWFERWTKRRPFDFRIEVFVDGRWKTLHHDTKNAVVGSFRNHLSLDLGDSAPEKFRFTSTTPNRSGVMIDDLRLVHSSPMRVVSIASRQPVLPVLIGNEVNIALEIRVEAQGNRQPQSLSQIRLLFKRPVDMSVIEHVQILCNGTSSTIPSRNIDSLANTAKPFGSAIKPAEELVFKDNQTLQPGTNHFFVSVKLKNKADASRRIDLRCASLKIGNKTVHPKPSVPHRGQRIGYALRKTGDDGSNTFRIPGLVTTKKGTLIGVYDVRRRSGRDLPGDIDVGMSRSTDGGRTWEPMRTIMNMGNDPKWRYDGVGDPAVLVDRQTGTIWVAATWSHGNRSWFGSGPGLKPDETGQLMLARSDDDGQTWSKPINITSQAKRPEWCFLLQGPGKGITMRDGTLVFAAQFQDTPANKRLPRSSILYSKDHGKTWSVGNGAFDDTTEAQVVEIEPGVLMLNCRYNRESTRVVMTTRDMGKTWQVHPTSRRSLKEPRACMASLIDVDREVGKNVGGWLLFSNPDSTRSRSHITIKASNDRGKTWPKQHRLLLDEGRGAGYSCMTMIDEKTVGILYEGSGAHLTFQRIPLRDIIGQQRSAARPKKLTSLRMPQVFGSHMVLQADRAIPVWGSARPKAQVTVTIGDDKRATCADEHGKWLVRHAARKASTTPIEMIVASDGNSIVFRDILIGEVWVCAGQSNMEWPLVRSTNGKQELASADHPTIRLLNLVGGARGSSGSYASEHLARLRPEDFCKGQWEIASAQSAANFSAVAWYFGRSLSEKLRVPIGLICPAVGGSPAEAWIPREALQRDPQLKDMLVGNWLDNKLLGEFCRRRGTQNLLRAIQAGEHIPSDELGPNHSFKPGFMWQAGIEPLTPIGIRGVIWYQGESNAESRARVLQHGRLFPMLVKEWRARWKQGGFPFLYVQLPALRRAHWPLFRDQQRRFLETINDVGMAITIDTGNPANVHPPLKKPVGERLARWALGNTYRSNNTSTFTGPLLNEVSRKGNAAIVAFNHTGTGLTTTDGLPPRHFEVAGDDGVFHPSTRTIVAKHAVSVSSKHVASPKYVRYAWKPFPQPSVNLVNSVGLPVSPFSTRNNEEANP